MCGLVGAVFDNPSTKDISILEKVFLESEIRGKHASGIAWVSDRLHMEQQSIPISQFMKKFDLNKTIYQNKIRLIGHIRYSTSDLDYNQPIGNEEGYIVHNGVISQASPDRWENLFGYKCRTKNDSELLLYSFLNKEDYNKKFKGCSVSALFIDKEGNITNTRNSLRPQWVGCLSSGYIIASTKNILLRSGVSDIKKVKSSDNRELINRSLNV